MIHDLKTVPVELFLFSGVLKINMVKILDRWTFLSSNYYLQNNNRSLRVPCYIIANTPAGGPTSLLCLRQCFYL